MEPTAFDAAQMERLAMSAFFILHDAARVASGKWIEVIHHCPRRGKQSTVVPARVAAYLCQALGEEQAFTEYEEVEFRSKGGASTGRLRPSVLGLAACNRALMAWLRADMRYCKRMMKRNMVKMLNAKKGGAAL